MCHVSGAVVSCGNAIQEIWDGKVLRFAPTFGGEENQNATREER